MSFSEGAKEEKMTRFMGRVASLSLVDVRELDLLRLHRENLGANGGGGGRRNWVDHRLVYPMAEVSCLRYMRDDARATHRSRLDLFVFQSSRLRYGRIKNIQRGT